MGQSIGRALKRETFARKSGIGSEVNPYAPPGVDGGAPKRLPRKGKKRGRGHGRKDIEIALEALREHLSNPAEVRADMRAVGRRLGTFTMAFLGLAAFCLVLTMILPGDEDMSVGRASRARAAVTRAGCG